jgi:hypothetical protein
MSSSRLRPVTAKQALGGELDVAAVVDGERIEIARVLGVSVADQVARVQWLLLGRRDPMPAGITTWRAPA